MNEDGLFYVTIETSKDNPTKTLVIGNKNGIIKTQDIQFNSIYYSVNCQFAYHNYFGFTARNSGNKASYLQLFYYNNNSTISTIKINTQRSVNNYASENLSCFTFANNDYYQFVSNNGSGYVSLALYNLTSDTYTHQDTSTYGHVAGCVIKGTSSDFVYAIGPGHNSTSGKYGVRYNKATTINYQSSSTTLSNVISGFAQMYTYYCNMPVINGDNKILFTSTKSGYTDKYYKLTYPDDFSTIDIVYLRSYFSNKFGTFYLVIEKNQLGYDAYYVDKTTYNIVKVQNAFNF